MQQNHLIHFPAVPLPHVQSLAFLGESAAASVIHSEPFELPCQDAMAMAMAVQATLFVNTGTFKCSFITLRAVVNGAVETECSTLTEDDHFLNQNGHKICPSQFLESYFTDDSPMAARNVLYDAILSEIENSGSTRAQAFFTISGRF